MKLEDLQKAAEAISSLQNTVLIMCEEIDSEKEMHNKEKIKNAILDVELLLISAESAYNYILEELKKEKENG